MLSRYISSRRLRINSCQRLPNAPAAHTTSASATAYHPKRAGVDSERPRQNTAAAASSGAITMQMYAAGSATEGTKTKMTNCNTKNEIGRYSDMETADLGGKVEPTGRRSGGTS